MPKNVDPNIFVLAKKFCPPDGGGPINNRPSTNWVMLLSLENKRSKAVPFVIAFFFLYCCKKYLVFEF